MSIYTNTPLWNRMSTDQQSSLAEALELMRHEMWKAAQCEFNEAMTVAQCAPCPHCRQRPKMENRRLVLCQSYYEALRKR